MGILDLINSTLELTGTVLNFISDSRGWAIKKEVEDLLEKINEQEKMESHLRDNQMLDDLYDAVDLKLRLFSSYLKAQDIQGTKN